jgi:flagellar hook-associated protein 1 FlgK
MAVYTDSGVTLFNVTARSVSFQPTDTFTANTAGASVFADDVPVAGMGAVMPLRSGAISGLMDVRDNLAVSYQNQLDEIARGLVEAFQETDQSAIPSASPQRGLFTYAGAAGVPATGILVKGLAGQITVAVRADPDQGGDALRLRDGNISGAGSAFVYNTANAAGFASRIQELAENTGQERVFDAAAGLSQNAVVTDFASSSAAWLQEMRKTYAGQRDSEQATQQRATEALSNATGVNLDDETARLLELERAFQASSRIISAIDTIYDSLFQAIR